MLNPLKKLYTNLITKQKETGNFEYLNFEYLVK